MPVRFLYGVFYKVIGFFIFPFCFFCVEGYALIFYPGRSGTYLAGWGTVIKETLCNAEVQHYFSNQE